MSGINEEQINSIFEAIINIAQLDYTTKAIITDGNSRLDDIASGVNMLSEQLEHLMTERKKTEKSIEENELQLNIAQRIAKIGSWELDIETGAVTWSDEMYSVYNCNPETFTPTVNSLIELLHPDYRKALSNWIVLAVAGKNQPALDFRLDTADGSVKWIRGQGEVIFNEAGKPVKAHGTAQDITESKLAEEKLKQALKEVTDYKYALDEASIVAITDTNGIIKYANDNFCKISQYRREELIGQNHRLINSGYHPKSFFRDMWAAIGRGEIWKGELKNKAKDGTYYWVDTNIIPFVNEQGKPYQYLAIRRDISKRKQAEESLYELNTRLEQRIDERTREIVSSKKYFKALIENSSDAVILIDQDGNIIYQSPAVEKIGGYPLAETLGKPAVQFMHPDDMLDLCSIHAGSGGETGGIVC